MGATGAARQIDSQKHQIHQAQATITSMHGEMESMRGKVQEALKLADIAKNLEEKITSVQSRRDRETGHYRPSRRSDLHTCA